MRYAANLIEDAIRPYEGDPANVSSHITLGFIYYEWNNLEASTFHHEQVIKLSRLSNHPNIVLANNYLNLARTIAARGEVDLAKEALEAADRIIPDNPEDRAISTGYHIAVNFLMGNTKPIAKWLDLLANIEMRPWGLPVVTHYLLFLRMGITVARQAIKASSEQWATKARGSLQIQFQITWAMLFTDEMDTSMKHLAQALTLGKPEGFVRSFVDFGMAIAPLLREAISREIEPEYARKLLDIIEAEEYQRKLKKPGTSSSDNGLLSRREMEVLRLMAEGLSNQQISDKLMISLNTAKTHVYRVFDKLNANDRLAAINRARDLKLIK
jgi:LuxR family maltose regulon positive regulatory protein